MLDLDSIKRHFRHLKRMPILLEIGALQVDVIKINYVPPGPGWHVPEHKHSSYEFHFITSGKGHICMDQIPFHVEMNQFYLTGPEIVQDARASRRSCTFQPTASRPHVQACH